MLVVRHRGVALVLLAFALLVAPAMARAANCTPDASWGTPNRAVAQQVAVQLNQQRAANGLGALALSPTLTASAEWKSLHMAYYGYFDHSDPAPPVARTAGQRMVDCGYTNPGIGENIAEGFNTVSSVMDAWMNSAGHRANILGAFTVMGVGVAVDVNGAYFWTVDFGSVADAGTVPVGTAPPAPTPTTTTPPPPPPPPPAPTTTTPPATTPTTTAPTPTPVKSTTTATTGATTPAAAAANSVIGTSAARTAIGTPVSSTHRLVALPDAFHARPGRPRILRPLGNDENPSGLPLRILKILEQPRGSQASVVRHGHAIRVRLPHGAHGTQRLVYLVSTAAGEVAQGLITLIVRPLP